jgi:hypothetical protein
MVCCFDMSVQTTAKGVSRCDQKLNEYRDGVTFGFVANQAHQIAR